MSFVVDASVTLAWCFEDEARPYAESVLDRLRGTQAMVPAIWPLEVANALLVAERRGRLAEAQTARLVELLASLPIDVDTEGLAHAWDTIVALGREHRLSAYDAGYLELAMRQGLPLATQDEGLKKVAGRAGIALVE